MSATSDEDDAMTIAAARSAAHFMVSIFVGPGRGYWRVPVATLELARHGGAIMEAVLANHRLSMVYAVSAQGGSVFVSRRLDADIIKGDAHNE